MMHEAAVWLARRDRGLSAAEQDAFLQWLHEDSRHREALTRLDGTWTSLDSLTQWQPEHSAHPNPDLLEPKQFRRRYFLRAGLLTAGLAAAITAGLWTRFMPQPVSMPNEAAASASPGLHVIPGPDRMELPDGSIADTRFGSHIEVAFTEHERRVRLLEGELHVDVTKNPARPFVVEVDGAAVRALGTAFAVRRGAYAIDVLVTEGRVQLEPSRAGELQKAQTTALVAGQRAHVDTTSPDAPPLVTQISPAEIDRELAWRSVRLEFESLPLSAVVAEFNMRNRRQLHIGDSIAGKVRVAGTFRADQVEVFARLLEASFGIQVDRPADGPWVLRKRE